MGLAHAESSQRLYTCPGEKSVQLLPRRLFPGFNRNPVKGVQTGLPSMQSKGEGERSERERKMEVGEVKRERGE